MLENSKNYDDIINLTRHISKKHPRMSLEARSAQFAPFAALTGYDDVINEAARLTTERIEINEELQEILDEKLKNIKNKISINPEITVTYFVPDKRKNGGKYITVTGRIIKIDNYKQMIILEKGIYIPISEIIDIIDTL